MTVADMWVAGHIGLTNTTGVWLAGVRLAGPMHRADQHNRCVVGRTHRVDQHNRRVVGRTREVDEGHTGSCEKRNPQGLWGIANRRRCMHLQGHAHAC